MLPNVCTMLCLIPTSQTPLLAQKDRDTAQAVPILPILAK